MSLPELRPASIEAHLRFLSHPLLEGRGAGARGGRLAEEYIRSAFRAAGLLPVDGGDYRQIVPMVGMDARPRLAFDSPLDRFEPVFRDEYVLGAGIPAERVDVDAELLFAGYGIHAPEYGWDDYGDVDVTGKILLIRVNEPHDPERPDFFGGRALTYYGRWTYKFEEAARRGAAGALLIHTDASAGYGWNVVRSSNTGTQYQLADSPRFPLQIRGWVTEGVAKRLLARSDDDLLAASELPSFRIRAANFRVRAAVDSTLESVESANVIGMLPGSDPDRADEAVILMAHHDHLGIRITPEGHSIVHPGAYDNASGVALLLSIAQAFGASDARLRRPLIFLATTAEESGLLGSEWYTRHPLVPLRRTAAILNVDGVNLQGPTSDIAPLGMGRSTLSEVVARAAAAESLDVTPEQHPEQGMFFRQDHFPFARAGVPAIAFDHGLKYRDRPEGWGEAWYEEFNTRHYHQPSDAFREDFDYRGAVQQGRVMMRAAAEVAQADELPNWYEGSEFSRP